MKTRFIYRYTSNDEGVFSAGKRLLPKSLVDEAWEARKWIPKPRLPKKVEYRFYLTLEGKRMYKKTLLKVHKKYLTNIKCEKISLEDKAKVVYEDKWQVVVKV